MNCRHNERKATLSAMTAELASSLTAVRPTPRKCETRVVSGITHTSLPSLCAHHPPPSLTSLARRLTLGVMVRRFELHTTPPRTRLEQIAVGCANIRVL
jgi:hypothetical protein